MALIAPKIVAPPVVVPEVNLVPVVNIAINPTDGSRTMTIMFPKPKVYTEEELDVLTAKHGVRPAATCDFTGELIFKPKNVNTLKSERPEFNNLIISTKFLKKLLGMNEQEA